MGTQASAADGRRIHVLPWLLGLFIVVVFSGQARRIEGLSSFSGYVSAILFIVANVYYPARLIARQFRPMPDTVVAFFKKYLDIHVWMNEVAFFAMVVHAHYAEDGNVVLTALGAVTVFLTVEGLIMHYRLVPGQQRLLRMLHAQQILFVVWVLLMIIGHSIE